MVETAREPELEEEPENVTELLHSHVKLSQIRSCFLWVNKESGFSRWNEYAGEYAMNIVEMAAMDLEYYIQLTKQCQCLRGTDFNFERSYNYG